MRIRAISGRRWQTEANDCRHYQNGNHATWLLKSQSSKCQPCR
nr:MAG TPA: hypothetical protein [Caudoviricetes sp.]